MYETRPDICIFFTVVFVLVRVMCETGFKVLIYNIGVSLSYLYKNYILQYTKYCHLVTFCYISTPFSTIHKKQVCRGLNVSIYLFSFRT